jgi:hypothetical protein
MARVEIPSVVQDAEGNIVDASVFVYQRGTTTQAPVYVTSSGGAPISQPLTTTGGRIEGWVEEGRYDLTISYGSTTRTQPWEAVSFHDLSPYAPLASPIFTGTIGLPSYTIATRPAATTASKLIFVSDAANGSRLQWSDGTTWRSAADTWGNLSATTPDKLAWQLAGGTIIELYGQDTAAGYTAVNTETFDTNPTAAWTVSDGSVYDNTNKNLLYVSSKSAVGSRSDWGPFNDTAAASIDATFTNTNSSIVQVGFFRSGPGTFSGNLVMAWNLNSNDLTIAINNSAADTVVATGLAAPVTGVTYRLTLTRNGNTVLWDIRRIDTGAILTSGSLTIPVGQQANFGSGASIGYIGWSAQTGSTGSFRLDNMTYLASQPEARDLYVAVTPAGGARTVRRIFGSLGAATFRSDFALAADLTTVGAPNVQTASYTLTLADAGKAVEISSASATTLTIPPNSAVAFPIGTVIEVHRYGAGTVTLAAGAGVTIRSAGSKLAIGNQYSSVSLRKRATDEWILNGDLA